MRIIIAGFAIFVFSLIAVAQADLQKLVDTEHAFASLASEQGAKAAFLANMADDALVFNPDRTNAKPFWSARGSNGSLLSWAPNYADISSNGTIGYTTGNWEFRPKGKTDAPSGFGEFVTVWLRQPTGEYKFVIDIGVGHDKPVKYSNDWTTSDEKIKDANEKNLSPADIASGFLQAAGKSGLSRAYGLYASTDIRIYRENKSPIIGKKNVLASLKGNKGVVAFAKRSTFFGSGDISYNLGTYTMSEGGKVIEKGNSMEIWKLVNGKWQIVLDILKEVPVK